MRHSVLRSNLSWKHSFTRSAWEASKIEPPSKTAKMARRRLRAIGRRPPYDRLRALDCNRNGNRNGWRGENHSIIGKRTLFCKTHLWWNGQTHFFVHKHSVDRASAKCAKHQQSEMGNPFFWIRSKDQLVRKTLGGEMSQKNFWCISTAWT